MIKLAIALMLVGNALLAEDAVWGVDGSLQSFTERDGSVIYLWSVDGKLKGYIMTNENSSFTDAGR